MIKSVRIENFKAIYTAEMLQLNPFTAFIGNNGSGKSSVFEALRLLQLCIKSTPGNAFKEVGQLESLRNYNAVLDIPQRTENGFQKKYEPVKVFLSAEINGKSYEYTVYLNTEIEDRFVVIEKELLVCDGEAIIDANVVKDDGIGHVFLKRGNAQAEVNYNASMLFTSVFFPSESIEINEFQRYALSWQFLYLNAHDMGKPVIQDRNEVTGLSVTGLFSGDLVKEIKLAYDGRNVADYLLWLREQGQEYLDNLIRKMLFVLPYIQDLQPNVIDSFNKEVELLLIEQSKNSRPLPGWLLSSGTLRILAILAMFETPKKPSVLFIDEVENGLDPRTIGLLINEIEKVYREKSMQILVTTHSPYFLDMVPLESIIVTEKDQMGTSFHIPKDEDSLKIWKDKFSPGKLYTMGQLTK